MSLGELEQFIHPTSTPTKNVSGIIEKFKSISEAGKETASELIL